MRTRLAAFCLLAGFTTAQADHVVVASRTGTPATSLFDADLATGAIQPLGGFSLDRFPPLAVAVDQVNRDVVLALQTPIGGTVLVRLQFRGATVVREQSLGDVPGIATALAQALGGSWITTTDQGVFATERNGSVARRIVALPRVSAIETFGHLSGQAVIAQSGGGGADPQVRWLDFATGQTIAGPWVYVGHSPQGLTGIGDLPTGLSRQVVGQTDGTVAMSVNFANPVPLPLTPVLPAGATQALHMRGLEGVALGDSAHPFLKSFQALGGTQWTILAGPLAGAPVDFAFRPAVVAATVTFGPSCAGMLLGEVSGTGPPRLGNAGFALSLTRGQASAPAVLLLGASDQRFGALRLPAVLPGGCVGLVSGELVFAGATNMFGEAAVALPVPLSVSLHGAIVFAQWLQVRGSGVDASDAGALWLAI